MRLGELLLRSGAITATQLDAALAEQKKSGGRLGTNLVTSGFIDPDTLARTLGRQHRVPAVLMKHLQQADFSITSLFPASIAERYGAIPVGFTTDRARHLVVAMMDPSRSVADEISMRIGRPVEIGVAPELQILRCLE